MQKGEVDFQARLFHSLRHCGDDRIAKRSGRTDKTSTGSAAAPRLSLLTRPAWLPAPSFPREQHQNVALPHPPSHTITTSSPPPPPPLDLSGTLVSDQLWPPVPSRATSGGQRCLLTATSLPQHWHTLTSVYV